MTPPQKKRRRPPARKKSVFRVRAKTLRAAGTAREKMSDTKSARFPRPYRSDTYGPPGPRWGGFGRQPGRWRPDECTAGRATARPMCSMMRGKGVLGETDSGGNPPNVCVPQCKGAGEAVMSQNVQANRARTKERSVEDSKWPRLGHGRGRGGSDEESELRYKRSLNPSLWVNPSPIPL